MIPSRVQVVCLAVGSASDEYVLKLESMLRRYMPVSFDLACIVDRPRPLPDSVAQIDGSGWSPPRDGMKMTTYKLSLYDAARLPFKEFLYLDTSLVIGCDMTPMLEFAYGRPEELVVVDDWNYSAYNTCVMRIRPGGVLAGIPRAYEDGVVYEQKIPGDQDYVTAFIRDHNLTDQVALWPDAFIASYKKARRLSRTDRRAAKAMLQDAIIVKFHGEPKMHQLLDPKYRLQQMIKKVQPWHANAWFWVKELRERWH